MTDIERYVKDKTLEELIRTQRTSVIGGDVHQAVTLEIQRIQQNTNNTQIANLIGEVKALKDITKTNAETSTQNAKSSHKVAVAAFFIGAISLLIAALQMKIIYNHNCSYTGTASLKNETVMCESYLRIGAYNFYWVDKERQPV